MRLGMRKRRHNLKAFVLPLFCIFFVYCIHILLKRAEPSFVAQASNYSNTAFTDLVNKCIIDIAAKDDYKSFFAISKNSDSKITAIESDTAKINLMKAELLINIQNALNSDYPAKVNIPLGSLSNYYVLSSLGPSIPIKIIPISIVNGEFDEEFISTGINQVKHKIYLEITVDMLYSGYLLHETERISTTVPIAEAVIVGDTPEYYGAGMAFSAK